MTPHPHSGPAASTPGRNQWPSSPHLVKHLNQDGKFPSSLRRGKGVVSGVIIWPHGKSLNRTRSETEPLHLSKAGNSPLGVKEGYVGKVSQRSHSSPSDLSPLLCWSRYGHCQESSTP